MKFLKPIGLCILGLFIIIANVISMNEKVIIPDGSPTAEAKLDNDYEEVTTRKKSSQSKTYNVKYTYKVDGKTYRHSETITMEPKPTMTVHYLKDKPEIGRIDKDIHEMFGLYILGGIAMVIGGIIWFVIIRRKSQG
jgi:hypothetical protein